MSRRTPGDNRKKRNSKGWRERRKQKERTYRSRHRYLLGARSGWRGVGFGIGSGHEAYDAELAVIAYGLLHLAARGQTERSYTIFTDSTAAMTRAASDASGPSQELAIRIIGFARQIVDQGNTITIRWTPAHVEAEGNERADREARGAASLLPLRATVRRHTLAFLRRRAAERSTRAWKEDIEVRNAGCRAFRLPTATPGIRPQLRRAPKRVAARFFQLLSGHAIIAPFLKDRWGRTDSDRCRWCEKGRQSREHLFKDCSAWTKEIRELWRAVGEAPGEGQD